MMKLQFVVIAKLMKIELKKLMAKTYKNNRAIVANPNGSSAFVKSPNF